MRHGDSHPGNVYDIGGERCVVTGTDPIKLAIAEYGTGSTMVITSSGVEDEKTLKKRLDYERSQKAAKDMAIRSRCTRHRNPGRR